MCYARAAEVGAENRNFCRRIWEVLTQRSFMQPFYEGNNLNHILIKYQAEKLPVFISLNLLYFLFLIVMLS